VNTQGQTGVARGAVAHSLSGPRPVRHSFNINVLKIAQLTIVHSHWEVANVCYNNFRILHRTDSQQRPFDSSSFAESGNMQRSGIPHTLRLLPICLYFNVRIPPTTRNAGST